jgi:hypothetical protein
MPARRYRLHAARDSRAADGRGQGFDYLKRLHRNVNQYTKSGAAPAKATSLGETLIGITGTALHAPFPPLPLGLWNGEVAWRAAVVDCRGLGCASPESGRLTAEVTPLLMSISRGVLPRSVPRPSSYCRCPVEIGCSSSTALSCYQMANFASRTGAIDGPLSEPSHRRNRF